MDLSHLLSAKEVSRQLGVTHGRVRQLARAAAAGTKHGPIWFFSAADVEAMRGRRTQHGPAVGTVKRGPRS